MTIETDDRGRVYLPKEIRERHGERFRLVNLPNRVVLIPVDEDPLEAVRDAVGDSFAGQSIAELKAEGRERAREEALAEVEERE